MDIMKAYEYAKEKHSGQKRKDGTPYIEHPIRVARQVALLGVNYQVAALFHDLLEDTDATEDEIRDLSNEDVLIAVKLVTKKKGYDKDEYISNILNNPIAKAVKNADRIDNLTDAVNAKVDFQRRYLKETEKYYLGRFSPELDKAYEDLKAHVEDQTYTIDSSLGDFSPLYRTANNKAWRFNRVNGRWVETDPFFFADLDDNGVELTEEEAAKYVGQSI